MKAKRGITIQNLIAKIFESYGFLTQIRDEIVIAEKNNAITIVGNAVDKTTIEKLRTYLDIVSALGYHNPAYMFAAIGGINADAKEFAKTKRITVWDRENLEWEIGRVVLNELLETPDTERVALDEFFSELSSELLERELMHALQNKKQPKVELSPECKEMVIRPKVSAESIRELGYHGVQGFEYRMELVPYYLYEYSCELLSSSAPLDNTFKGAQMEKKKGLIGINALTRECEEWNTVYECVPTLEQSHIKLEPKIDDLKAAQLAKQFVIDTNTTVRENKTEKGTALIIERKKIRPKEESVELKLLGLLYMPVWCVEGSRGVMICNAATGKIIREDFY